MEKRRFLVTVEKHYTQKVTYEVEAINDSDAYGEALKPNPTVFSLETIIPSNLIYVQDVVSRQSFACGNCSESYFTSEFLQAHLDDRHHLAAYWVG